MHAGKGLLDQRCFPMAKLGWEKANRRDRDQQAQRDEIADRAAQ